MSRASACKRRNAPGWLGWITGPASVIARAPAGIEDLATHVVCAAAARYATLAA
jgi:hypothetical protein